MAGTVNKVILVGRLGKDPETRSVAGGQTVTTFSIATDETWTDRSGEKQSRTDWHNIVAWGKLGDICGQYLKKGKLVYIEGSIRNESWEDKESGQKRTATKINAAQMQMLDKRDDGDGGGRERGNYKDRDDNRGGGRSSYGGGRNDEFADDDEEVPF